MSDTRREKSFAPSRMVRELVAHSQRSTTRPGRGVISLASGDPDQITPEHIRAALTAAVSSGWTHYSHPRGDHELRGLISDTLARVAGRPHSIDEIIVTSGGTGGLAASILACVDAGDRVILPNPVYSLYADLVRMAGGVPVFVRQSPSFHLDIERLRDACIGARMVVLCHPCNPTGVVYRPDELETLAEIAIAEDLLVLADEAYDHIVFDGVAFTSTLLLPRLADRLIYCQTLSKTFAMTGWRIGYVAAPAAIADAIARVNQTLSLSVNTPVQRAALAALAGPSDFVERMRREYQSRRDLVVAGLEAMPGVAFQPPEGTFYAFVRYPGSVPSVQLALIAQERGVALRPGSEFGPDGEGYLRLSFATSRSSLAEGLARLRGVFAGLDA